MARKLLLADDSITIQKVIGITFANEDYELTVVDNGADAVAKAKEIKPDLVLADVVMPEKDGYQVCREIKADPALASTPVILLTGTFEPFDEAKSKEVGADDSITKPFESQTLIDKVKNHLEKTAGAAPQVPPAPEAVTVEAPSVPQPAAAEEEIVDLGEEELWDISEEAAGEEMPVTPAAEAVQEAPEEEIWSDEEFADFGVSEEIEAEAEPVAESVSELAGEEETVSDEELWGGIDFGEEPAPEMAPEAPAAEEEPLVTEEEFADFELEEEAVPSEEVAAESVETVSEEMFEFEEKGEALPEVEMPSVPPQVPVEEKPAEPQPAEAGAAIASELSEERVNEIVSKAAREIIEKIAWEVVPELAETLIKEEIKRLKGE